MVKKLRKDKAKISGCERAMASSTILPLNQCSILFLSLPSKFTLPFHFFLLKLILILKLWNLILGNRSFLEVENYDYFAN